MAILQGRVSLRPITADDYPLLVKWNRDPELHELMGAAYPESIEGCADWHRQILGDRQRQLFGIEVEGIGLIGDVELDHIAWRSGDAELRIRIGEPQWRGRGFGTEAVRLLLAYAFGALRLNRVYLRVLSYNAPAIACYRKAGFKAEGVVTRRVDGDLREIVLMRILRDEFQNHNAA